MKPETYKYLYELDATGWEFPEDFDYAAEMNAAEQVKPEIETITGHALWQDRCVQDASHFTEFAWLDERHYTPGKGGALVPHIAVRFSAFDRMVTIYSGNDDEKGLMRFEPQIAAALIQKNTKK